MFSRQCKPSAIVCEIGLHHDAVSARRQRILSAGTPVLDFLRGSLQRFIRFDPPSKSAVLVQGLQPTGPTGDQQATPAKKVKTRLPYRANKIQGSDPAGCGC